MNYSELFNAAIKQEHLVSKIYLLFSEFFLKDKDFWFKLSMKEVTHTSILSSAKIYYETQISKAEELLYNNIECLK